MIRTVSRAGITGTPRQRDFVAEPHTGIIGENQGTIMNLVDARADRAQTALLEIANEHPEKTLRHLQMPPHHEVHAKNVDLKRLGAVLAVAYEKDLHDFAELLLLEKLGPRTLQSLALVAEVVHGAPSRFNDPARFSFAHGGNVITFSAIQRTNCCNTTGQDIAIYVDSTQVGTFHPSNTAYVEYSTAPFSTTSGAHTIKFAGLNVNGDQTAFMDKVRITGSPKPGFGVQWLVTDQLGTPRLILDQTGGLANIKRHDYLPFGEGCSPAPAPAPRRLDTRATMVYASSSPKKNGIMRQGWITSGPGITGRHKGGLQHLIHTCRARKSPTRKAGTGMLTASTILSSM